MTSISSLWASHAMKESIKFERADRPPPRLRAKGKNGSHDSAAARRQRPELNAHSLARARGRSARGFGQSGLGLKVRWPERGAPRPRGPATPAPPPAHTLPAARPPRNRAHASHARQHTPRLRNPSWRRPAAARAPRPRHHHDSTTRPATHDPKDRRHTPRDQNRNRAGPRHFLRKSRVSEDDDDIHVIKRNGRGVVRYDKITSRIKKLYTASTRNTSSRTYASVFSAPNSKLRRRRRRDGGHCDAIDAASGVCASREITEAVSRWSRSQGPDPEGHPGLYDGVTTHEPRRARGPDGGLHGYPTSALLAWPRESPPPIAQVTDKVFSDVVEKLHKHVHPKTKKPASLIADDVMR